MIKAIFRMPLRQTQGFIQSVFNFGNIDLDVPDYSTISRRSGSIDMEIERLVKKVHKLDGLIIPSHIDRESFSIISQLGYLPEIDFDALEITERYSLDYLKEKFNFKRDYSLIMSSDAHYIEDIGKRHTEFFIEELSFDEIRFALYNRKDRKVRI